MILDQDLTFCVEYFSILVKIIYTSILLKPMAHLKRSQDIFKKLCRFIDQGDQKSIEALLRAHHRRLDPSDAGLMIKHALHSKNPHLAYNLYRHVPLGHFGVKRRRQIGTVEDFMYESVAQGREDVAAVLCITEKRRIGTALNVACAALEANTPDIFIRWEHSTNNNIALERAVADVSHQPIVDYKGSKIQEFVQKAVNHPNVEFCNVLAAYDEFLPHMIAHSFSEHKFDRYCQLLDAAERHQKLRGSLLKVLVETHYPYTHFSPYSTEHLSYYHTLFERVGKQKWNTYIRGQLAQIKQPNCSTGVLQGLEMAYKFGSTDVFDQWSEFVGKVHPNHQEWASRLSKFILEDELNKSAFETQRCARKSKM